MPCSGNKDKIGITKQGWTLTIRSHQNIRVNYRVVYKSWQPAKFPGFSARFCPLLSLLHDSKYVEEKDPQPFTFHKTLAT